jgi:hypothetical protein
MYLSYSGWKKLKTCLYAYWNSYIGKTQVEADDDRLGSIYGSVIGKLFEDFYEKQGWRNPKPTQLVLDEVEAALDWTIKRETTPWRDRKGGVLLWKGKKKEGGNPKALYANREEIIEDLRESVLRGMRMIRFYRLLGPYARAEVKLDYEIGDHKLAGRADFIIKRVNPQNDLCIIDGKGSKWRHQYVDPKQLLWYAWLYRHHHGRSPDKLAFLYWRYDPPESMDWVDFTEEDLDELEEDVLGSIRKVEELRNRLAPTRATYEKVRSLFRPAAEIQQDATDACRFCPFATTEVCPAGEEVVRKIARRKR